jgi:hypothetical protein
MTLVLELPPELERRLKEAADCHGVSSADFVLGLLQKHLVPADGEFQRVADYVLTKNAELHGRLAARGR